MTTNSKKGACSANVQAAKANCLKHNRRDENSVKIPTYVNPHLSHLNHIIFEDDMIKGRASIVPLVKRAELLYTQKTGQKCQKSFVPFREDCLSLPDRGDVTDAQLMAYKAKVEKEIGWKVIGMYYHKDEGYVGSKFIEGDDAFKTNYHVHVIYSCQDQETGKAIRPKRNYFSLRQDWLSAATGMERGNPASQTGRGRRSAMQQRIESQEQRIDELERIAKLQEEKHLGELEKVVKEKIAVETERDKLQEQIITLNLKKAGKEKMLGLFGQSSKDKEISRLEAQISGEPMRTAEAVAKGRAEERAAVIAEIKTTANIKIKQDGSETAKDIGLSWRKNFDARKKLESELVKSEQSTAQAVAKVEKKVEKARKETDMWKGRFADIWPSALKAIEAIVTRVNSTWQNLFTVDQVKDIDAAMKDAVNINDRIKRGKQLVDYARPEFTRNEGDVAKQVEDIALNGLNVQKLGIVMSRS